jgi:Protein of unknown function (DUF4013)
MLLKYIPRYSKSSINLRGIKFMTIRSILDDAIRYPLSNWKKYLILGIIFLMGDLVYITRFDGSIVLTTNIAIEWFLGIIAFIIVLLTRGYFLRIINSSLNGASEPPEFNRWTDMFKDGVKLFIVGTVYIIPAIMIIIIFAILSYTSNPISVINTLSGATVWFLIGGTGIHTLLAWTETWFIILFVYMIIIVPITAMAYVSMANNGNQLLKAFQLKEIYKTIAIKGWGNFIKWYLVTGILFLILSFIIGIPIIIFTIIIHSFIGIIPLHLLEDELMSLLLAPYLYMYIARSITLFYKSDNESFINHKK